MKATGVHYALICCAKRTPSMTTYSQNLGRIITLVRVREN